MSNFIEKDDMNDEGKGVSFGTVEVRVYHRELSDNPSVTCGIPVGLDWKWDTSNIIPLNEYENERVPNRLEKKEFQSYGRLDQTERFNIARNAGWSEEEIRTIQDEIQRIQKERFDDLTSWHHSWSPWSSAKAVVVHWGNSMRAIATAKLFAHRWKERKRKEKERKSQENINENNDKINNKNDDDDDNTKNNNNNDNNNDKSNKDNDNDNEENSKNDTEERQPSPTKSNLKKKKEETENIDNNIENNKDKKDCIIS